MVNTRKRVSMGGAGEESTPKNKRLSTSNKLTPATKKANEKSTPRKQSVQIKKSEVKSPTKAKKAPDTPKKGVETPRRNGRNASNVSTPKSTILTVESVNKTTKKDEMINKSPKKTDEAKAAGARNSRSRRSVQSDSKAESNKEEMPESVEQKDDEAILSTPSKKPASKRKAPSTPATRVSRRSLRGRNVDEETIDSNNGDSKILDDEESGNCSEENKKDNVGKATPTKSSNGKLKELKESPLKQDSKTRLEDLKEESEEESDKTEKTDECAADSIKESSKEPIQEDIDMVDKEVKDNDDSNKTDTRGADLSENIDPKKSASEDVDIVDLGSDSGSESSVGSLTLHEGENAAADVLKLSAFLEDTKEDSKDDDDDEIQYVAHKPNESVVVANVSKLLKNISTNVIVTPSSAKQSSSEREGNSSPVKTSPLKPNVSIVETIDIGDESDEASSSATSESITVLSGEEEKGDTSNEAIGVSAAAAASGAISPTSVSTDKSDVISTTGSDSLSHMIPQVDGQCDKRSPKTVQQDLTSSNTAISGDLVDSGFVPRGKALLEFQMKNKGVQSVPRGRNVSRRGWKDPKQRANSVMKVKQLKTSWKKKMEVKEQRKSILALAASIKEDKKEKAEALKERQKINRIRTEENARKSEIVQTISDPRKIKRMKRKQLRYIEKRDTTDLRN